MPLIVNMSFRRCKGTAISTLPQSHYWGIPHTTSLVFQSDGTINTVR